MQVIRKIISGFVLLLSYSSLQAQTDSVLYQRDSVVMQESDLTVLFFQQHEKAASPPAVRLVTKANKIVTLPDFLSGIGIYANHALADLDKDGKKELLISNYTGGAHCCDEIYIFKNIAPNRFQYTVKFFAGNTTIAKDNEFIYNFHEQFSYFFTCHACSYTDTTDEAPIDFHNILLKYYKGKMLINPGDREMRNLITDNLGKLGEQPYEKLENDRAQDNGLRKEFAINLAVFYYTFGRNLVETQKLFNKYYKFPDAKKVWAEFARQLQIIKKDNDF
jgi:hypothetical protein